MAVGEGIEKKEEDFAAEVAKAAKRLKKNIYLQLILKQSSF